MWWCRGVETNNHYCVWISLLFLFFSPLLRPQLGNANVFWACCIWGKRCKTALQAVLLLSTCLVFRYYTNCKLQTVVTMHCLRASQSSLNLQCFATVFAWKLLRLHVDCEHDRLSLANGTNRILLLIRTVRHFAPDRKKLWVACQCITYIQLWSTSQMGKCHDKKVVRVPYSAQPQHSCSKLWLRKEGGSWE